MTDALSRWSIVKQVIEERRAVRDFDASEIDDGELREILAASLLAPTSSNLQLFRLHVVQTPEKRAAIAAACMSQRAARGAPVLIAVAACPGEGTASIAEQSAAHDVCAESLRSQQHTRDHLRKIGNLVRFAPSSLWAPLLRFGAWLARWFRPMPALPAGKRAFSAWAMRNSAFVAQTLMLAAQARGYASCPMEGFDPTRVRKALGLDAEDVWLIIAIGRRRTDARVDLRWRRPFSTLVKMH